MIRRPRGEEAASNPPLRSDTVVPMKVTVDLSICDLHGLCVDNAPEVFQIGDDGNLKLLQDSPPEELRAKVEKAARECPTGAITVEG